MVTDCCETGATARTPWSWALIASTSRALKGLAVALARPGPNWPGFMNRRLLPSLESSIRTFSVVPLPIVTMAMTAPTPMTMRSFLTVLGIVIGVGAVIAMVTIGNGTTEKVRMELAKLGSNLLFMRPGQFGPGRSSSTAKPFNVRDVEAIKGQLQGVRAIAPVSQQAATIVFGTENRVSVVK